MYRQSCHEISKKVEQCEARAQLDLLKMQKQQQEHGQLAGSSMELYYASQLKVAKQNGSLLPSTDSILQAPWDEYLEDSDIPSPVLKPSWLLSSEIGTVTQAEWEECLALEPFPNIDYVQDLLKQFDERDQTTAQNFGFAHHECNTLSVIPSQPCVIRYPALQDSPVFRRTLPEGHLAE